MLSLFTICAFFAAILFFSTGGTAAQSTTPNIVFILADDMGYGDPEPFSVFPAKNSHYKLLTPNLVQMAADGMTFTDAYAGAPVCAPSRCTLMLGRHSGHCSVRSNGPFLRLNDTTIATVLQNAKYETAMFGKWGLGVINSTQKNDPVSKGFQTYIGQLDQNECHNYYPYYQWNQQTQVFIEANKGATEQLCGEPDYQHCNWTGDLWQEYAVSYLSDPARKNNPFYLYLSFTTPHSGAVGSTKEYDVPVPRVTSSHYWQFNSTWNRVEIDYASAVTQVDAFVGEILATIKKAGLDDNTIVFFASDNGASNEGGQNYAFFASSGPLSGFKRSLKEGGHRSPLIVRWPNVVPSGVVSNHQWAFYDFMATASELAGVDAKDLPQNDGLSMVPTLKGQTQAQPAFIYHEYCNPNEYKNGWGQAVRVGDMTGVCVGPQPTSATDIPVCNSTSFMLFDLAKDIGQTQNIGAANQDTVQQIMKVMVDQHTQGHYCGGYAQEDDNEFA